MSAEQFQVDVSVQYLDEQSLPEQEHYLFAYSITIRNHSAEAARLYTRSWKIIDGNGDITEVHGAGVVGKHPLIAAGESFNYTSSIVIDTPVGTMEGSYTFKSEQNIFDVAVPIFTLAVPGTMN